jgi:hypothetical protein
MIFEMANAANIALLELGVDRQKVQWKSLQIASSSSRGTINQGASIQQRAQNASTPSRTLGKSFEVIYDQGGWFAGVFSESTNRIRYCRGWIHVYPDRVTFESSNCQFVSHFDHGIASLREVKLNRLPLPDINLPAFHVKVKKGKNYNFASRATQEIVHAIQSSPEYAEK